MPLTLQYASCLFANRSLRTAWTALKPGASPTLALLGNCISFVTEKDKDMSLKFLTQCSKHWDRIYLVPGPLEYASKEQTPYMYQIDSVKATIQSATKNVAILNQGEVRFEREGFVLLGASLWSYPLAESEPRPIFDHFKIPATWPEFDMWVANDGTPRRIQKTHLKSLYESDRLWLKTRFLWYSIHNPQTKIVLLTHTLPSLHFMSQYLPKETYDRAPLELTPIGPNKLEDSMNQIKNGPYAWLTGAGLGGGTSGYLRNTFISNNALFTSIEKGVPQNPQYMSNRTLFF